MHRTARLGGPLLLLLLLGQLVAGPALARPATGSKRPPAPAAGWPVERVRVEPATPGSVAGVDGLGDYRGTLDLVPAPGGGVAVIDDVGLEDYVQGISEVPSTWPPEALKAQAIAARTYALYEMANPAQTPARAVGADLCATDSCQVYAGLAKERGPAGGAWVAAVNATAGRVLVYKGKPILAKYSASNGGRSVPGGLPYLQAVNDPDDVLAPEHHWHIALPLDQARAAFDLPGPIVAAARAGDGVRLDWQSDPATSGEAQVPVADFRAKLKSTFPPVGGLPETVPSYQFSVSVDEPGNALVLDGRGWGHGIGLSQYGALGKAMRGLKAADILAKYYAGLRPVAVPAASLPSHVRVAVDLGRPAATLAGTGVLRLSDGAGHLAALAGAGGWVVRADGPGRLRVVPPPGQEGPPSVQDGTVQPGTVRPGGTARIRFTLSAPATVSLTLVDGRGATVVSATPVVLAAGPASGVVAGPSLLGAYTVTVVADAGQGRVASAPFALEVAGGVPTRSHHPSARAALAGPAAPHASGRAPLGLLRPLAIAALVLAVAGGAGAALASGARRARRGTALH